MAHKRRSEKNFKNLTSTSFDVIKYHFVCLENYKFILLVNYQLDFWHATASLHWYINASHLKND